MIRDHDSSDHDRQASVSIAQSSEFFRNNREERRTISLVILAIIIFRYDRLPFAHCDTFELPNTSLAGERDIEKPLPAVHEVTLAVVVDSAGGIYIGAVIDCSKEHLESIGRTSLLNKQSSSGNFSLGQPAISESAGKRLLALPPGAHTSNVPELW
jgi:hypothetical protein